VVAKLIGVKYGKNARASCKKLFEKLKANAPAQAEDNSVKPVTTGNNEDDEEEEPKPKVKKGTAKKVAAPKKVGARAAPKKSAAPKKPAKRVKKEEDDEGDDGVKSAEEEFAAGNEELLDNGPDGKLSPVVPSLPNQDASIGPPEVSSPLSWKSVMNGVEATFPAGYTFPADATEDEIYHAHSHEITVEAWRVWTQQNNYFDDRASTPS
jgi:hypothetical protein